MFAYCKNNPTNYTDPYGLLEIAWNNNAVEFKLENRVDMLIPILLTDGAVSADLAVTLFYASLTAGTSSAVPVCAGFAFATMESLAKLGVDFAVGVNDITTAREIMSDQGYVYYYLDINDIPNPLSAIESKVSAKQRIDKPYRKATAQASINKPNQANDHRVVAQVGKMSVIMEAK